MSVPLAMQRWPEITFTAAVKYARLQCQEAYILGVRIDDA